MVVCIATPIRRFIRNCLSRPAQIRRRRTLPGRPQLASMPCMVPVSTVRALADKSQAAPKADAMALPRYRFLWPIQKPGFARVARDRGLCATTMGLITYGKLLAAQKTPGLHPAHSLANEHGKPGLLTPRFLRLRCHPVFPFPLSGARFHPPGSPASSERLSACPRRLICSAASR